MPTSPIDSAPTARLATLLGAGLLAAVGVAGGGALSSSAQFTDSRSTQPATVSSGTLALSTSGGASAGSWTGSLSLVPGDPAYAGLTVTNGGTVPLRYAVSAQSTSALAASLHLTVVVLPSGTTTCSATTYAAGTRVSTQNGPFGASPAVDVIGSVAAGAQAGDRNLAVAAGERLCLRVLLPTGTGLGAAARGTSAAATFTVVAESS